MMGGDGDKTELPALPLRLESFDWADSASLPAFWALGTIANAEKPHAIRRPR